MYLLVSFQFEFFFRAFSLLFFFIVFRARSQVKSVLSSFSISCSYFRKRLHFISILFILVVLCSVFSYRHTCMHGVVYVCVLWTRSVFLKSFTPTTWYIFSSFFFIYFFHFKICTFFFIWFDVSLPIRTYSRMIKVNVYYYTNNMEIR